MTDLLMFMLPHFFPPLQPLNEIWRGSMPGASQNSGFLSEEITVVSLSEDRQTHTKGTFDYFFYTLNDNKDKVYFGLNVVLSACH